MKNIDDYIKNYSQVKLYYFEDEIYAYILKQSKEFILIVDIVDWHFHSYMIFPKKYIKKIKYKKLEKFREKVMKKVNNNNYNPLDYLDIHSLDSIFLSLKNNYNLICIEGATKDVNQFIIGQIVKFNSNKLYVNKLNPYAKLSIKHTQIPKKDITCIYFDDEYSKKLFKYYNNKK